MSESIKLRTVLNSETPYQEQVALVARFLGRLPMNSHYDVNGLTDLLMRNIIRQLGVRHQGSFKVSMHRDTNWMRGLEIMKGLTFHEVASIGEAAREQLKKLQFDYSISSKPISFAAATLHGDQLSFNHYRNRVVVIHFWKLGCPHCASSLSRLKKIHDLWHVRGFEVIGVAVDSKKGALLKRALKWPHVMESSNDEQALHRRLNVKKFPSWYFFDKRGLLVSANLDLHEYFSFEIEKLIREHV